ncbi:rho GTPase-activating protein gacV-like [Aphis gossypii]|uniref:rho GTPase-activating protein gacV-like n=1 Tax=Aphis gossypii TaxID=80765 RepID=UPI0021594726|nr:rho GTPase-activating protein gacV-like [Aphis gossypii]
MALRDHDYVIPANHEEVGVPNLNLFLQDHNYAQRPAIQIQEEQEEDQPQAEGEDQPQAEEQEENQPQEEGEEEEQQQARTYRIIPGI